MISKLAVLNFIETLKIQFRHALTSYSLMFLLNTLLSADMLFTYTIKKVFTTYGSLKGNIFE